MQGASSPVSPISLLSSISIAACTLALARADANAAPAAEVARERPSFDYRVDMAAPHRHEFALSLRFTDLPGERAVLSLPKWNPGAYALTDAHRNVRGVIAHPLDGRGRAIAERVLPVSKLDENDWEVEHGGEDFELSYQVYCGESVEIDSCHLDDAAGFFNAAYLFMSLRGHEDVPIDLRVESPPGGKAAQVITGLAAHPEARGSERGRRFWAEDFDALIDAPVHAGEVDVLRFDLYGRPVRVVMAGEGSYDADALREQIQKICEAAVAVFGPPDTAIPFRDYTFIYHLRPDGHGGLEHRNSTVIGHDPWKFSGGGLERFWAVTAHEFFHLWNVKRIRPAVLGPFDYDREVHTTMLWFSEGFTSYYTILINRRAGLIDEAQARVDLAKRIAGVESRPGHTQLSVEQSSWETWAKPDDYDNAYFSYYDKGAALGLILDLELRAQSGGQASTDTLFRTLWQRWRDTGLGLSPEELEQAVVDELGGGRGEDAIRAIFRDYVRGTVEVDYDRYLAHAGYRLERSVASPGPWIDAKVGRRGETMVVTSVEREGAGDRGGLGRGDVITAINGHAVDSSSYWRVLDGLEIGEPARFSVERGGRTLELEIVPVKGGEPRFEIVDLDVVSAEQLRLRRAWLGLD
ncbi:M61 family metallopeptidase [Pseudenhygromyxa sp. WMMC2535]|uniref:M61 family metallopeptidase n=1 Tax=Pseudenhygromyxa sp. WMMC2535 TaxID=2712867 RepID=UPI001551C9EB|nr:PDZ domain-containing protein [Pseudenhygromyxa sp. WMMC2535]NVB40727.1 M61 family metallopeptidase [Pseudenhygromyxa sp. WMMC2535]